MNIAVLFYRHNHCISSQTGELHLHHEVPAFLRFCVFAELGRERAPPESHDSLTVQQWVVRSKALLASDDCSNREKMDRGFDRYMVQMNSSTSRYVMI